MSAEVIEFRSDPMKLGKPPTKKTQQPAAPREVATRPAPVTVGNPASSATDWGINAAAVDLPANADIEAIPGPTRGSVGRARRYDVFSLLFFRPKSRLAPTSYDAVRRLQSDIAVLHRTQGASDSPHTTGKGATGALAALTDGFSLARRVAGERVDEALAGMKPWCARLIRDLCETEVVRGQTPNWQATVVRHTGEMDRMKRGDLVRQACDDLAESYRRIDNKPKRDVA